MRTLSSILADPSNDSRAMFKTAVRAIPEFGQIYLATSMNEVSSHVESTIRPLDIIFISHRIDQSDCSGFLNSFRDTAVSSGTAVIQILKTSDANSTNIATRVALGFNGILCEPFSGDGLRNCAQLSVSLQLSGTKARIRAALKLIIPLLAREAAKNGGRLDRPLSRDHRELAESCKVLHELAESTGASYESLINEVFDDLKKDATDVYLGVSARLKTKFELERSVQEELRCEVLQLRET